LQDSIKKGFFEKVIRLVAVVGPLTGVPQAVNVWVYGSVAGVSLMSWFLFMVFSGLWLAHALRRNDRPLAVSNLLWLVVDVVVILGVVFAKGLTDSGPHTLISKALLRCFFFSYA
jgi:uncharacterized protein with PQ loop repeat